MKSFIVKERFTPRSSSALSMQTGTLRPALIEDLHPTAKRVIAG
jgi:hypothetical protein